MTARFACRLCGATEAQRFIGQEQRLGWGQALYRCGVCNNGYLHPDMAPERLTEFYRNEFRRLFFVEAAWRYDAALVSTLRLRQIARCRLRTIAGRLPPKPRVLELGSGMGAFLAEVAATYPGADLHAIEPDVAHRTVATAGASVSFHEQLDALPTDARFDLIALFHTLEHAPDPATLLRLLRERLTPTGLMLIEVPDCQAPWTGWNNVHPAHLSYFTSSGLDRLLGAAGLAPAGPSTLFPETLWRIVTAGPPLPATAAAAAEVAAFDALLDRVGWTRGQALRKRLRQVAVALLGPAGVGAIQRQGLKRQTDATLVRVLTPDTAAEHRAIVLGAPVDPLGFDACRTLARSALARQRPPLRVGDLNVAKLMQVRDDPDLLVALAGCGLICADGMGIVWAGRALNIPIPDRVTGIDLMQALLADCAENGWKPYLLGAETSVLTAAVTRLQQRFPALTLAGHHHGYFSAAEAPAIVAAIRASGADCLIVGMGSPRQELFLERYFNDLGVTLAMGVGGSFDVLAGRFKRAPQWMQRAGLEWLARLAQDPRRLFRRYLTSNSRLLGLLLLAKLRQWRH